MQPGSGGVPTRQRGFPKCPAVLGWVAAGQNGFLQFAEEPEIGTSRQAISVAVNNLKAEGKIESVDEKVRKGNLDWVVTYYRVKG